MTRAVWKIEREGRRFDYSLALRLSGASVEDWDMKFREAVAHI